MTVAAASRYSDINPSAAERGYEDVSGEGFLNPMLDQSEWVQSNFIVPLLCGL